VMMCVINKASKRRCVAQPKMNDNLSHSHKVFIALIVCSDSVLLDGDRKSVVKGGQLHMVNMVWSKRQSQTEGRRVPSVEAGNTNKSWST
jgi:hypothetical protein